MKTAPFNHAFQAGFDRLAAWSDLLDAINVFPVADGDTGRNLQISLAPLKIFSTDRADEHLTTLLLKAGRGNSGNIATQFFSEFIQLPSTPMAEAAQKGARAAYQAVRVPREGTMLSVFDTLGEQLRACPWSGQNHDAAGLLEALRTTVRSSRETLSSLRLAGVVDAGALGMYLFFEGFFLTLVGRIDDCLPPGQSFPDSLKVKSDYRVRDDQGYCVDTVLRSGTDVDTLVQELGEDAGSVVTMTRGDLIKLHFHTGDRDIARRALEASGTLLSWSDDDLAQQVKRFQHKPGTNRVHIVTDGAASLTRTDQDRYGFTLLDSYIVMPDGARPETRVTARKLYARMRSGEPITTSQASVFERHQHYQRLLDTYSEIVYLCTGSAFTGNYDIAKTWQSTHDPENRMTVIDTGAASGRLAVMVLAAIHLANQGAGRAAIMAQVQRSLAACREYIFIDRLKYLAAGGRLSRSSAIFGDLLQVKPVISPLPTGAEKIGSVKTRAAQRRFALQRLKNDLAGKEKPLVLLEYTDNREWVETQVGALLQKTFPSAEIVLQPLSLTTGVHTGPGTWAVAAHPDPGDLTTASA